MGVSKVVYGDDTLVDLTGDTVTPTSLTLGATAHGADGEPIVGEYQYVLPPMSSDTRGGARIQPDSGLEITDTDNLQVRLALESDGTVRGGIAELTAKGHAEQVSTTGKNLLPNTATSQTINGVTFTTNPDGSVTCNGTATADARLTLATRVMIASDCFLSGRPSSGFTGSVQLYANEGTTNYYDSGRGVTVPAGTYSFLIIVRSGAVCTNAVFYPQLELGSTATEYEPYTGGAPSPSPDYPQEIQVVRGRNLLDATAVTSGKYLASDGTETNDASYSISDYIPVEVGATYVTSGIGAVSSAYYAWYNASKTYISATQQTANGFTLTAPANAAYVRVSLLNASLGTSQLEVGSTPQPYVPYGHVGMEARDPDTDELISCTALPLPSRGWVAGLPDGTADALYLDGAGKCEWTLPTKMQVFDGSSAVDWINNGSSGHSWRYTAMDARDDGDSSTTDILCDQYRPVTFHNTYSGEATAYIDHGVNIRNGAWLSFTDESYDSLSAFLAALNQNPVTVLYLLATPVTEDCGYCEDWPTDIPEGAVIDIPELSEVGIKFFIDSAVTELAKQWYARAYAELGDAVTELAGRVAALES